ncbi:hypothetical protein HY988_07705 [Candidatus Micrarchaeota archaeon]|nr:hypothetical protein [Candidatus Micrarchaeota archaeon]
MKTIIGLMFLLIISASFAQIIETQPGDNGKQFASDTSAAKCKDTNAKAVYVCYGNVVKVVWKDSAQGSTFYKPDGQVVNCPPGTPAQMGAQCLQMMTPNYCPGSSQCGSSPPETFPGLNPVPSDNTSKNVTPTTPAPEPTPVVKPTPNPEPTPAKNNTIVDNSGSPSYPANVDNNFNNLILVLIVIAIVAIIVLFTMFRSSLHT